MINNKIACINVEETVAKQGNFIVASKSNNYKKLQIKHIPKDNPFTEEGLREDAFIYTLSTAGVEIPIKGVNYTVIDLRDILIID